MQAEFSVSKGWNKGTDWKKWDPESWNKDVYEGHNEVWNPKAGRCDAFFVSGKGLSSLASSHF